MPQSLSLVIHFHTATAVQLLIWTLSCAMRDTRKEKLLFTINCTTKILITTNCAKRIPVSYFIALQYQLFILGVAANYNLYSLVHVF